MCAQKTKLDRIAVGRGAGCTASGNAAVRAGNILNDNRLTQRLFHPIGKDAANSVDYAAGWGWHNHTDRACRIGLGPHAPREGRQRGSAGSQMQKISAGKFHDVPPEMQWDDNGGQAIRPSLTTVNSTF